MADIFQNTENRFGGAFATQHANMTFSNSDQRAGVLVQNANFQYTQAVTRLYEVGEEVVYYVGGRANGQVSLGRVIGPGLLLGQFYRTYGDVCQAGLNNITFNLPTRCAASTNPTSYRAMFVVITSVGLAVAAADLVVNESSSAMFSALEYNDGV